MVYTILAYPKNWLKLAPISSVGNNTSCYPSEVFHPLSSSSPILKYTTSTASRGIVYKLKSKVVPTYLLYSQIIYKSLVQTSEMSYWILDNEVWAMSNNLGHFLFFLIFIIPFSIFFYNLVFLFFFL